MTRLRRILLAASLPMLALGCGLHPPPGWTVSGGTPAQQEQALQLLDAARVVAPGALQGDGGIAIVGPAELPGYCMQPATGCAYHTGARDAVVVLDTPDLATGALPHELAHHITDNCDDQVAADQLGALIVAEYRRAHP